MLHLQKNVSLCSECFLKRISQSNDWISISFHVWSPNSSTLRSVRSIFLPVGSPIFLFPCGEHECEADISERLLKSRSMFHVYGFDITAVCWDGIYTQSAVAGKLSTIFLNFFFKKGILKGDRNFQGFSWNSIFFA